MPLTAHPEWQQLALYALGAAVVLTLLFRIPRVGIILRSVLSLAVLAFGLLLLFQQVPYDPGLSRLMAQMGLNSQEVVGEEVQIRMSRDGHFWAEVDINGVRRRMLIDSGATVSALSNQTALAAGVDRDAAFVPVMLQTANGTVAARTGKVKHLALAGIEARDLRVVVSPALGSIDVLGMNFLSELASWRVEGRTLVLTPVPGEQPSLRRRPGDERPGREASRLE
ncbi:MAG: TIGR02281 family clan AA aspartic protease [Caulobacter sp.]|nr:TIGR02281 family clan AA aspartic protease [Caulobacter sp.]